MTYRKSMTHSFDATAFQGNLQCLDDDRRLAFGVCIFERSLPGFFQFQIDTGSTGGGELRSALAQCWSVLETGFDAPALVSTATCELVMPNSEEHTSVYTSAAIDSVNIACCLLDFLALRQLDPLIEAVQSRHDTVDLFIQNSMNLATPGPGLEERIASHPLMREELGFLYDDIAFLRATVGPRKAVWRATLNQVVTHGYERLRLARK